MSNNKKWWIVIVYTMIIFASLPVARQMWGFVGNKCGFFILIGLYVSSVGFLYIRIRNMFYIGIISILAIAVFKFVNPPIVRIHFIEYGILGWLSYWAGGKKAFVYIIAIGILDELIQGVLPNRVFDIRDICMNVIGGGIGIIMRAYAR